MESTSCPTCGKIFSRTDNLQRHIRQHHQHDPAQPMNQSPDITSKMFQHPFTMTVSGPTGCGKTQWVKDILTNGLIQPPPQRILFLYKRWQPLYDVIAANIAHVTFFNGIPPNLDSDECLDPKVRNLVILDDLMTSCTKDTKVTDLFCEGSHHRNLSVIALNQNLYFSRDPTQRRNTQYLILFRNPVDQMPVHMLARQMYPQNVRYFIDHFNKATEKPYGHLVVDLKPHTPEHARLKGNITEASQDKMEVWDHSVVQGDGQKDDDMYHELLNQRRIHPKVHQPLTMNCHDNSQSFPCMDCGTLFQTMYDLQKHIQHWCPINEDTDTEPPRKKPCLEQESTEFKHLMKKALDSNDSQFVSKAKFFKKKGFSKSQAIHHAKNSMVKHDIKTFLQMYRSLLEHILRLYGNPLHQSIVSMALSLRKEMSDEHAIKTAIQHFKKEFDFEEIIGEAESSVAKDEAETIEHDEDESTDYTEEEEEKEEDKEEGEEDKEEGEEED